MKICSVTISRTGAFAEMKEAIVTVRDLVDASLPYAGGEITDFSEIRNAALAFAHERQFDWAIMLDTDERLIWDEEIISDVRAWLGTTDADVIMVPHWSRTYEKERIFRLPARGHYVGPTHEAWITDEGATRITLPSLKFDEIPKSSEQYRAKVERDRDILEEYVVRHPKDPRWWYYLADTYSGLGATDDAIATFATCYRLNGWDEESAWAAYRVASLLAEQCAYAEAIDWCVWGLIRRADFPEFPWLAGWCAYKQTNYQQAIRWERMAIAMTYTPGGRIGFRYPPAHADGPWDVLRYAYRALGDEHQAAFAEERFMREQTRREQDQPH